MPRYPGARWRPIPRYQPGGSAHQVMERWDAGVDHTYVGSPTPDAAFAHFNVTGTPLPHFMVFRDGSIDQYVDTAFRSSACLDGNHRVIAWETADGYPGLWTNGQAPKDTPVMVTAKAKLMAWLHTEHGIPLVRMPSSKPTARGMGWHRLGIDGNYEQSPGLLLGGRVPGGESWSPSFGKTCPTSVRIHQFVEETIPAAVKLANPPPPAPTKVSHLRHVHASGKSSSPAVTPVELAAALTYYVTDPAVRADVITMTEVGTSDARTALVTWADKSGWHVHHPEGRGRAECAVLSAVPFAEKRSTRLTPLTLRSARSAPLYATSARPERGPWFSVTHTPAHNGGLDPTGKTAWPTRVYLSLAAGWHVARMRMRGHGVVLAADWNLALELAKNRARLARPYPNMTWGWHPGQGATEGGRVIDGILTTLPHGNSTTLPAQLGFDHRAVLTVLEVGS